jgi:integrase
VNDFATPMMLTGMRPGEVLALTWDDVNLTVGTVAVQKKFYRLGKLEIWGSTKTDENGEATLTASPALVAEWQRIKGAQDRDRHILGTAYHNRRLIFCQPNGNPLHERNIAQRDFRRIWTKLKLSYMRLYDLRHCNATYSAQVAPASIVQRRLRHKSFATTAKYYIHHIPNGDRECANRLEADLGLAQGISTGENASLHPAAKP